MDGFEILFDGRPLTDVSPLNSIISPRFIRPSSISLAINHLKYGLMRTADRARNLGSWLERFEVLFGRTSAYTRTELLKILFDWRPTGKLRSAYSMIQAHKTAEEP